MPKFPAYRLAQDTRGNDPPCVLIQLFKKLHLFGSQCLFLSVFPNFCVSHIHGGSGKFHHFILLWVSAVYRDALAEQPLEEKVAEIQADPDYTTLAEIPEIYLDAVVAVEDHRFEQHFGIDLIAIGRAAWNNLTSWSLREGGSTITQQLAKNLYFTQEKSFIRKIAEMFMAFRLENTYTKDEILELYVNSIYFGDGYYCIYDASQGYFGKAPIDMTDYECTLLAGIPNAPSVYSLTANPELAEQRQEYVVQRMVQYGYISEDEAQSILQDQS